MHSQPVLVLVNTKDSALGKQYTEYALYALQIDVSVKMDGSIPSLPRDFLYSCRRSTFWLLPQVIISHLNATIYCTTKMM